MAAALRALGLRIRSTPPPFTMLGPANTTAAVSFFRKTITTTTCIYNHSLMPIKFSNGFKVRGFHSGFCRKVAGKKMFFGSVSTSRCSLTNNNWPLLLGKAMKEKKYQGATTQISKGQEPGYVFKYNLLKRTHAVLFMVNMKVGKVLHYHLNRILMRAVEEMFDKLFYLVLSGAAVAIITNTADSLPGLVALHNRRLESLVGVSTEDDNADALKAVADLLERKDEEIKGLKLTLGIKNKELTDLHKLANKQQQRIRELSAALKDAKSKD